MCRRLQTGGGRLLADVSPVGHLLRSVPYCPRGLGISDSDALPDCPSDLPGGCPPDPSWPAPTAGSVQVRRAEEGLGEGPDGRLSPLLRWTRKVSVVLSALMLLYYVWYTAAQGGGIPSLVRSVGQTAVLLLVVVGKWAGRRTGCAAMGAPRRPTGPAMGLWWSSRFSSSSCATPSFRPRMGPCRRERVFYETKI